jgi:hypothetical protein
MSGCAALLQRQQLLSAESLVMDLGRGLDQILEMSTGEEVSQVDEFTVRLVLDVNNAPPVLAAADLLASNNDRLLGANNRERDDILYMILVSGHRLLFASQTLI